MEILRLWCGHSSEETFNFFKNEIEILCMCRIEKIRGSNCHDTRKEKTIASTDKAG